MLDAGFGCRLPMLPPLIDTVSNAIVMTLSMIEVDPPFQSMDVAATFQAFPQPERFGLLCLRRLIFETAAGTVGVGRLEEALKWGQPSYLTSETRSGSTIRLGLVRQGGYAIYVHCQTTILSEFRSLFPDDFCYLGNRAIHFAAGQSLPHGKLGHLIQRALTYHQSKRRPKRSR